MPTERTGVHHSDSSRPGHWFAVLCALFAAVIGLMIFVPGLAVSLLSSNETSFRVRPSTQADVIFLPPTSGDIRVRFDPVHNVQVAPGQRLSIGDPFVIEQCTGGCRIRFSLVDDQVATRVSIAYVAGDSEYVNDIARSYEPSS